MDMSREDAKFDANDVRYSYNKYLNLVKRKLYVHT